MSNRSYRQEIRPLDTKKLPEELVPELQEPKVASKKESRRRLSGLLTHHSLRTHIHNNRV